MNKTLQLTIFSNFLVVLSATFGLCNLAQAQGALSNGHTTAECIADDACNETVLNRIQTRMGTLEYQAGFPTTDTVERIYNEMDYQRAVLAHQISDNLVSFYSMHVGPQEAIEGASLGDLVVWENFLDPKGKVLTGNDTTVYGMAYLDLENNDPIDSSKNYRIRMPADFPARNFWSVFGYDSHTRTFIANGTKGRHLSSNDDLVKNLDGSIDVYIGPDAPEGIESNWIETLPGSSIFIGLRTYGPEESVLTGAYKIPRFELVNQN